jgi:hypothetical protein
LLRSDPPALAFVGDANHILYAMHARIAGRAFAGRQVQPGQRFERGRQWPTTAGKGSGRDETDAIGWPRPGSRR